MRTTVSITRPVVFPASQKHCHNYEHHRYGYADNHAVDTACCLLGVVEFLFLHHHAVIVASGHGFGADSPYGLIVFPCGLFRNFRSDEIAELRIVAYETGA